MMSELTSASHRSPFHASTMSLAGLLLCMFTSLAVLISVSRDQSGANLSEVTAAFNGSLRNHGREDFAVIAAGFRKATHKPNDDFAEKSKTSRNASRQKLFRGATVMESEEQESGQSPTAQRFPVDVNEPVFSHLVTELERHCSILRSAEFDGQLAFDLHSQSHQSDSAVRTAIEQMLRTCRKANEQVAEKSTEFEIVVWASTPTSDALANATDKAFDLERSVQKSLKANRRSPTLLSSSGRIWTHPNSARPIATIFVRTAKQ